MITKKERKQAEAFARSQYQDVIKVDVKEDPENESSLIVIVTRGREMPPMKLERSNSTEKK